jgi:hypothetical protein
MKGNKCALDATFCTQIDAGGDVTGGAAPAAALERICDPGLEDCRAPLLTLISNETQGIDVAFWFMEDAGTAPMWDRVDRAGSTVAAYTSEDGVSWSFIGSDTIAFPGTVYVGLAVTSHSSGTAATATFDNVQ